MTVNSNRVIATTPGRGAAKHPVKQARCAVGALLAAGILAWAAPLQAQNLGLTIDQFIERIGTASEAAGESLSFQELSCMENPKPGDETQTITSCAHSLGGGRLLITNAEPAGPLVDISTQPWDGGSGGPAALMISWIASAINDGAQSDYMAAADKLAKAASANGDGSSTLGRAAFYVLDFGGQLTITAQAQ